jgi:trimeric autotransporter adhesin
MRFKRGRLVVVSFCVIALLAVSQPASALVKPTPASTWQADGRVHVILRIGQTVYIGGAFNSLFDHSGNSVSRSHVAALNANTGAPLPWNPGTNGTVFAMVASPDHARLYIGGSFSTVGNASRPRVAAFATASGAITPFQAVVAGGGVRALAASSTAVYLGGSFGRVDGATRGGLAALTPAAGDLTGWDPGPTAGGRVRTLSLPIATRLVVGGSFDSIGGVDGHNLTAIDPTTGNVLSWNSRPNDAVISMTSSGGSVYAGTRNNLANRYDPSTGGLQFSKHGNGNVQALAVLDGVLYIGGHFLEFAGIPEPKLAAANALTGATIQWDATANSPLGVFALCGNRRLYLGGDFTRITGTQQARFAILS